MSDRYKLLIEKNKRLIQQYNENCGNLENNSSTSSDIPEAADNVKKLSNVTVRPHSAMVNSKNDVKNEVVRSRPKTTTNRLKPPLLESNKGSIQERKVFKSESRPESVNRSRSTTSELRQESSNKTSSSSESRPPSVIHHKLDFRPVSRTKSIPVPNPEINSQYKCAPRDPRPDSAKQSVLNRAPSVDSLKLDNLKKFIINNTEYTQFAKIGKGGSSRVYQCYSAYHKCTVAVKVVDLEDEPDEIKESFINEVKLLEKLQKSKRVVKLYDYQILPDYLYVVMEIGDTDFLSYLNQNDLSILTVKHYFTEMLKCVQAIHEEGIVHADLKPANFLIVKGSLKLIDFGIASAIPADMTCAVKDYQSGTVNYMSPESFTINRDLPIKLRKAADIWSLGCILYLMVFRNPPYAKFADRRAAILERKKIDFKNHQDELFIDAVKKCMTYDHKYRPTAEEMLRHPFLQTDSSNTSSFYNSNSSISKYTNPIEIDENFIAKEAEELKKLNLTPRSTVKHLAARFNKNNQ